MIKMRITRCMATMDYNIYFYHENDRGVKSFAKPVEIVIEHKEENNYGMMIEPTIKINCDAFDFAIENDVKTASDQLIKQKQTDKQEHIESLEEIIYRLIDKKQ